MIDLKNNLKFLIFFKYILIIGLFLSMILPAMYNKNLFMILSNYHIYEVYLALLFTFVFWCFYRVMRILMKKEVENV